MIWIKFQDMLPPDGTPVLITNGHEIVLAKMDGYFVGRYTYRDKLCWDPVGWEFYEGHETFDFSKLSHWCELPELPEAI